MHDCKKLEPLVTPFVDGELAAAERETVEAHVGQCPVCHSRVTAERAIRELMRARQPVLQQETAPPALRVRCQAACLSEVARPRPPRPESADGRAPSPSLDLERVGPGAAWRARMVPLALAASLLLVVGGAFVYEVTAQSSRVLVAELAADHIKCFAAGGAPGKPEAEPARVESTMFASFGWRLRLPAQPERAGLDLVGARRCLYGQGRVAHIMYRHNGRPVSVFMLPHVVRPGELVEVMGHAAAIWSTGDRTFVLIARESRGEVERMASVVQTELQ